MLSGLQATVIQQTQNLIKSASALNESFTGQGLGYSPGGFNCPNYRTDIAVESATNPHNASFVQPTISVNQFHSHVKSEPANYTYTVDAEGTEDSNSVHPIYDNLSASPSQRLNSPNNKSSSPRGLGLEVVVPSRPNTSSGNRCNSLTS
ncbi:unnamed protein product [Heterobilharzia americana]|nr:unnamed protein product [Heterobilharzia americana]